MAKQETRTRRRRRNTPDPVLEQRKGTVMLCSGELDKAIAAFEVAAGFQAMGMEMSMWFVMFGVNSIKKPHGCLSPAKWWRRKTRTTPGRNPDTDVATQRLVRALNPSGAQHLPLSQLNFGGVGGALMRRVMRHKGIAQLEELVAAARDLGVRFTICQICVDMLVIEAPDDLVVDAEVKGISSYYLEAADACYNAVF